MAKSPIECNGVCVCVLITQTCPILCHPMDCSPPGSSVHGILQTRILEWVAISFSKYATVFLLITLHIFTYVKVQSIDP